MRNVRKIFLIFLFCLFSLQAFSHENNTKINVAILDNFHFQPSINDQYDKYYLSGLNLAKYDFYKKGYDISYKVFKYNQDPLDIFKVIPIVLAWSPDVIIGPRNSNMFLMTRDSFKNILVISPFATSSLVKKMPKNYYSLTLPVFFTAQAALKFINKKFPGKKVFSIYEINCKNCVDLSSAFESQYNAMHQSDKLRSKFFLQSEAETLNIDSLLKGYKPGQIIFLPDTSYASAVLIVRIVNYLKSPVIFVGADDWGNWDNTEVGKLNANFPYVAYRITSLSLCLKKHEIYSFIDKYKNFYKKPPNDASYLFYKTIDSIITSINLYGSKYRHDNMKNLILFSYMDALQKNPNWFRATNFAIYQITPGKEVYIDSVNLDNIKGKSFEGESFK